MQFERNHELLGFLKEDFDSYLKDFDIDMDFLANQADYNRINKEFESIKENQYFKPYFLRGAKFSMPRFETVKEDISELMSLGKILDTTEYQTPLVTVNTFNLEVFQFSDKMKQFDKVTVIDEENLIPRIPKYFKFILTSEEEIMLLGGYDQIMKRSS